MASSPTPDPTKQSHLGVVVDVMEAGEPSVVEEAHRYRLYKWRFPGIIGLVLLNVAGGMNWTWFGSISAQTASDFNISISQVNWLGNAVNLVFLPCSFATPFLCKRCGIRGCCFFGAIFLILASWVRFAGTAESLSPEGAYALLFLGQVLGGIAQPIFLVLGPKYSEAWFDFNGRTTATMIVSVANPIGSALGELIPSVSGSTRSSILVLGIISTVIAGASFLIRSAPPTPPTFSGSRPSPPPMSTIRSLLNCPRAGDRTLSLRTRIDFLIIFSIFGVLVAAANAFSLLTSQIFTPYGYSDTLSGLLAAVFILAGLVSAAITAPLFDRVFTRHITITVKTATPFLALGWLGLIWAVRADNLGPLFAVLAIMGTISLMLLPLSLELACEISQDAETSSGALWFSANLLSVVFVLIEDALTAGDDASPPRNMQKALIFVGVITCAPTLCCVFFFRGLQKESRRSLDAAKEAEARTTEMLPTPVEQKKDSEIL